MSLPTLATRPSVPTLSGGISPICSNTSYESPPSPALTVIEMDINSKFKELKKLASNIDILIKRYNDSTVNILDKDDYKSELKAIFDKLLKMQEKAASIKDILDDGDAEKKLSDDINTLFNATKNKVVSNETAVKKQMLKLINEAESTSTARSADIEVKKLALKVKNALVRFKQLKNEVEELSDVKNMSDHEIRSSLLASKEWRKELKLFLVLKESLDVDMVSVDIDEEVRTEFQTTYKETVELVTKFMSELTVADKDLSLHNLTDTKSKATVQYPDLFGGSLGENVFRFIKEFREAIEADHIRTADQVKTLLKYLKGKSEINLRRES